MESAGESLSLPQAGSDNLSRDDISSTGGASHIDHALCYRTRAERESIEVVHVEPALSAATQISLTADSIVYVPSVKSTSSFHQPISESYHSDPFLAILSGHDLAATSLPALVDSNSLINTVASTDAPAHVISSHSTHHAIDSNSQDDIRTVVGNETEDSPNYADQSPIHPSSQASPRDDIGHSAASSTECSTFLQATGSNSTTNNFSGHILPVTLARPPSNSSCIPHHSPTPPPPSLNVNTPSNSLTSSSRCSEYTPLKAVKHSVIPEGVEHFLKLVSSRDLNAVRTGLKEGMNPNAQNEENQSPLHLAVLTGHVDIVQVLLESSACDPNVQDIAYNAPLHIAACHCDPRIRCSADFSTFWSNYPKGIEIEISQALAADATPMEQIVILLCNDPRTNVNIRNAALHIPLIYACLNGNFTLAHFLVKSGASVNAATHTDTYPLHIACENGFSDIARLLVENGALVNVRDYEGYTPLHLAARGNFGALCGYLWKLQADLNAVTNPTPTVAAGIKPFELASEPELRFFLAGMKTSSSHPLEINFVQHSILGQSKIGMTMCPGRFKKDHRRNLSMDIASLLKAGTQVLVTLVQQHELDSMGIPSMITNVRKAGIEVLHAPIRDKWLPSRMQILVDLVDLIVERVKQGKIITIHCNGGKGRTGLVVVGTLVCLGMEPDVATDLIRKARPGMLYNPAQIVYVRLYRRNIRARADPNTVPEPVETAINGVEIIELPPIIEGDLVPAVANTQSASPSPSSSSTSAKIMQTLSGSSSPSNISPSSSTQTTVVAGSPTSSSKVPNLIEDDPDPEYFI